MSFLSDLLKGNTGALGGDLWGSPTKDIETIGGVLGILGVGEGIAGLAGAGAAGGAAAGTAAAGAPLDILAGGAAEGTAGAADVGTFLAGGAGGAADATAALGADAYGGTALAGLDPAALGASGAALPTTATLDAGAIPQSISDADLAGISSNYGVDTNIADLPPSSPSFLSQLGTGALNSITKNPLGILASTAGLGLSILRGNQTDPNQAQLQAEAPAFLAQGQQLAGQGQQLQQYLTSGSLPPGQQAAVTQAVQAAKARIIANAAANGQNTNPTQNSALAQDLAAADQNGIVMAGQLEQQLFTSGTQLLQTGLNETGLSEQIYETLVKMDQTNNNQLMASIASMAAALGGGTKIQIGGTTGVTS